MTVCKRKSLTPVIVAQIIALHKAGLRTREIVVNVDVSERSVRNCVKCFKDNGGVELPSAKPRPGPSKKTSLPTLTVLRRQLESTHKVTDTKLKEKMPRLLSDVSIRTVNSRATELAGWLHTVSHRSLTHINICHCYYCF